MGLREKLGWRGKQEDAPGPLALDSSLLEASGFFDKAPWLDKVKNFAPLAQNTFKDNEGNAVSLWYQIEQTKEGEGGVIETVRVDREIPPGIWFKVKPNGEPQVLMNTVTKESTAHNFAELDQKVEGADQARKQAEKSQLGVTADESAVQRAIENIANRTKEKTATDIGLSAKNFPYAPERGRFRAVRVPLSGSLGEIDPEKAELRKWGGGAQKFSPENHAVLVLPEDGTSPYVNTLGGSGTLQNCTFNGKPIDAKTFKKLPVADPEVLKQIAERTAFRLELAKDRIAGKGNASTEND